MKDFYVQLMSNASTFDFPDNKANSSKNRLPYPLLFETDKEWKVGLVSISYPIPPARPHQVPSHRTHNFDDDDLLCHFEWTIETFILQSDGVTWRPSRYRVSFEIKGKDLHQDRSKVTSGKSLMQYLINRLNDRLTRYMERGDENLRAPDGKKYYPVFRWEGDDLILDNTDTFLDESGGRRRPKVLFGPKLTKTMGWIEEEAYDVVRMTTNMVKVFQNDVVPVGFKKDWINDDTAHSTNF